MDRYRIVKEAIFYAQKYRNLALVVFLGKENAERCEERGILRDVRFLKQMGMSILIGHYIPDLNVKKWHEVSGFIRKCGLGDLDKIKRYMSLGLVPVVYCEDNSNISSYENMALLSANVGARKLIFVTRQDGVYDTETGMLISEMSAREAGMVLDLTDNVTLRMKKKIEAAVVACKKGVPRVHIISGRKSGSLILEMFSCEGQGTMIYESDYRDIRRAKKEEVGEISDILRFSTPDFMVSPEKILSKIKQWHVFLIDGQVHGCMNLRKYIKEEALEASFLTTSKPHENQKTLRASFLTTSKPHENQKTLRQMVRYAVNEACSKGLRKMFIEKSKSIIWLGIFPWLYKEFEFQLARKGSLVRCSAEETRNIVWVRSL